ncbi:MAG: B12-binding domain-containing radical SAM protein [Candidatus Omnitrophota bacterium]|nr:B12-binding domain-containing radical SAM protein [Candidatus Omnitrophota bacterium]
MKKAFLLYPPTGLYDRSDRCQSYLESETGALVSPPMDILYMAAVLEKAGYRCFVRDYTIEKKGWADVRLDLERELPSVLVVSTTMSTLKEDLKACDMAKGIKPDCLTVAKGGYVGDDSEALLRVNGNLDIFINNEPEFVIREIVSLSRLQDIRGISYRAYGRTFTNQPRPFGDDLDSLPLPARHLIRNELYRMPDTRRRFTTILTGRGCPFKCIYCMAGKVGGAHLRLRSPENIVRELEECMTRFGIKDFWMRADTFTFDKKWVAEICRLITDKGLHIKWMTNSRVDRIDDEMLYAMKRSGCTVIGFGIESGNQGLLDRMKKGITLEQSRRAVEMCRKHRIKTYLNFIVGLPWESEETFEETIRFAKSLKADMYNFSISYPFPGTELYEYVKEKGLLKSDEDLKTYGFFEPVADTHYMKRERLGRLKEAAFRKVMLDPRFVLRTISNMRSPALIAAYCREAARLLGVIYGKTRKGKGPR